MDYNEATNFLFDLRRFGPRPGTESVAELLTELGDPHEDLTCIQIAGSNGKGSTARMTERALREAGLSVGLFTSPQIEEFRDRIRVDGRYIPESAVTAFVEEIAEYVRDRGAQGMSPTFFEVSTALALWYFNCQDIDIGVLEVGIGGSKDATSIVDPITSAVTSVTLEHADVLGDTVEEIARDKAHVVPTDRPIVTAASGSARGAIEDFAGPPITVGPTGAEEDNDVVVSYEGRTNDVEAGIHIESRNWAIETALPILGRHQAENAGVAATLVEEVHDALDMEFDPAMVARGFRQAHWPGRCEVMDRDPLVVLDGAHNEGACERLAEVIDEFEYDNLYLVVGAMHDKDHPAMAAALPTADEVIACRPDLDRAEDPGILAQVFDNAGAGSTSVIDPVEDALAAALERADPADCVLVTGSLFAVREARARWSRLYTPYRVEDSSMAKRVLSRAGATVPTVKRDEDRAVHRVIETRLNRRQADRLGELLRGVGADLAVADIDHDGERRRAIVMGTDEQLRTVIQETTSEPAGVARIGEELEAMLAESDREDATYPWEQETAIMGILNVTPDSFHDGGEYDRVSDARARAEEMVAAGVTIVDVGGESTRPGADPVPVETEIDRVVPVIEELGSLDVMISIDTRKAAVARAAIEAGADMINDVSGLEDPDMRFVAAEYDVPLVVMHSINTPVDPGADIEYDDVVRDVIAELSRTVLLAQRAGLDRSQIVVDPGLGFGKTNRENFELVERLDEFGALSCPVMVGHSHKSMFEATGHESGERLAPTIATTALAADRGADLIRIHDPAENVAAVRVVETARQCSRPDE